MKIGAVVSRIGRAATDLVLPPHCPTCDEIVAFDADFCAECFRQARFVVDPCCVLCALPFASDGYAGATRRCPACLAQPPAWDRARAAFVYDAFSRRLILPLKYADRTENAGVLGRHMRRAAASLLDEADLIIPVPLHRARLRSRRYNQAALLARACLSGRRSPRLLVDGLVRTRATAPLALRSPGERRREIQGAIAVRPALRALIDGARIILVDDVLTTGSTAAECTAALRDAGAACVSLLVAARTGPPRDDRDPLSCVPTGRPLPVMSVSGGKGPDA